jgi:hypothetical protein
MKEMDSLENRLRSCQPRRPSARLKRRLFAAPFSFMPKAAWLLGTLAPATACLLLTFSAFNADNTGNLLRREPITAMIMSNQNYAAYASDNYRGTENRLSSVTFDWTNHSGFTSSMAPFSPEK